MCRATCREVLELYLYLNMNAYLGELERTTSFKDKARQQPDNVNAGLLTYPSLMAADILMHKAVKVPVGKDQEQNMEMARKFARRFNTIYGVDFFTEPQSFSLGERALKVPGLDGSGKMARAKAMRSTSSTTRRRSRRRSCVPSRTLVLPSLTARSPSLSRTSSR